MRARRRSCRSAFPLGTAGEERRSVSGPDATGANLGRDLRGRLAPLHALKMLGRDAVGAADAQREARICPASSPRRNASHPRRFGKLGRRCESDPHDTPLVVPGASVASSALLGGTFATRGPRCGELFLSIEASTLPGSGLLLLGIAHRAPKVEYASPRWRAQHLVSRVTP